MISTDIELAVERLRSGGLVAVPTETVYGLAADAAQPAAVARIFEVKGRPTNHPLIVHLAGAEAIDQWALDVPVAATALASACWPGPLTMLLKRRPGVAETVAGGRDTIGLRSPAHSMTLDVLQRLGSGVAAPSANRFGKVSPTTAQHVFDDIGGLLDPDRDLILDGGPCEVGIESTIIDLTVTPPQVLRHGAITEHDVTHILDDELASSAGPSRSSGMLDAHYAPDTEVVAVESDDDLQREQSVRHARGERIGVLDRTDDLVVAARTLYADLRAADEAALDALLVVMPPADGLGHALRDRIMKAAAGSGRGRPSRADSAH